jgi:glycosyltransferase involved in cell wall biosynthesis
MRVGVVTTSFPRGRGDAVGSFVGDRVASLLSDGHEVEVVAAAGPLDLTAPALDRTLDARLSVTRLPARVAGGPDLFAGAGAPEALEGGGAGAWLAALGFSARLVAEVRARAPRWDRVESHWLAPCALAVVAGAPALPHRATAHSGDVAMLERVPLGRSFARVLAASGAHLHFVSERLRARFAALAGRPCGVVEALEVPSALFPRSPRPDPALRASLGFDGPTVVGVGRLVPIKGFDLLVRACAAAPGDRAPIRLALVGDGPEQARLRRLADALGVELTMPGRVPREEVASWLRAADLYAQPSRVLPNRRAEGLPVATLEALATGLSVVVSDSGGLAELAGRAAVRVVPSGDVPALATALRQGLSSTGEAHPFVTAV